MAGVQGDVARIEAALNTPTLKLLDRKSVSIALPLFANAFPEDAQPIPVEQFHTVIDALLDELRASGYTVTAGASGKSLAMQWVRERWLYRDPGRGEETYQLTSDAKQALEYVTSATRTQLNVSLSRIETLRRVVSEAALAATRTVRSASADSLSLDPPMSMAMVGLKRPGFGASSVTCEWLVGPHWFVHSSWLRLPPVGCVRGGASIDGCCTNEPSRR